MSKVRVCFLGTPEFAVTCLKAVLEDEHYEVVGVVTQPDRPAGRKLQLMPSAVKSYALAKGLKVISPESIKNKLILEEIERWGAEVAIVVAYGQILPQRFLEIFKLGAVNVHGSLLPLWRGAAPIQRSIEAGDKITGVALQKVVKELDAGDVIGFREIAVSDEMDAQQLHDELAKLGASMLKIELMDYVRGNLAPQAQDPSQVTYAKKIDKAEAEINWNVPASKIVNKVRAFVMGPGTFTLHNSKRLKIHKAKVESTNQVIDRAPGTVVKVDEKLVIVAGQGLVELLEVQPESRSRMSAQDFLKSQTIKLGDVLGK